MFICTFSPLLWVTTLTSAHYLTVDHVGDQLNSSSTSTAHTIANVPLYTPNDLATICNDQRAEVCVCECTRVYMFVSAHVCTCVCMHVCVCLLNQEVPLLMISKANYLQTGCLL